jgi:ubiquinone/menaquinone biosynthesis C-methylase UbiE
MSLNHYFSNDPEKRAKFIFNLIAPIYGKLDKAVAAGFIKSMEKLETKIGIKNKSVLDVGTGTGAWASLFLKSGASEVSGVDFSEKMLKKAEQGHPKISFSYGDAKNLKNIEDNKFDIVTASFVLHGTKREVRKVILSEMKRVSKQYVVIQDFVGKTPFGIKILEWLEKSDFVNFKETFEEEMREFFIESSILEVGGGSGLYIGKVY